MVVSYPISLEVKEPNNDIGILKIRQSDEESQTLVVQVLEYGLKKSYEGLQVFFCARIGQTDGLGIIEQKLLPAEMTDPKNGKLEYTMRAQDWQQLGRQTAYFSFRKMKDEHSFVQQFSTRDFTYEVTKNIFSDGSRQIVSDGSTYIWTIEDLKRLYEEYIASGKSDWEEFVEQNKEIIESVDPGGTVLSELIQARKPEGVTPFQTLGERLDWIDNNNSVEYYINNPDLLAHIPVATFKSFWTGVKFSKPVPYTVEDIAEDDVFYQTGNTKTYLISDNLEIKIGDKKIRPLMKNDILGAALGLGTDNDTVVFQKIMDYAYKNLIDIDLTDSESTLVETVYLDKPQNPRKLLNIRNGRINKYNNGLCFDTHFTIGQGSGGYSFSNVTFYGVDRRFNDEGEMLLQDYVTLFNPVILRTYFTDCEFYYIDCIYGSNDANIYMQSVYFKGCYVIGGINSLFRCEKAYDFSFVNGLVEHRWNFMNINIWNSVRISNNVIEGLYGLVAEGRQGRNLVIADNYFESNCLRTSKPYFSFNEANISVNTPYTIAFTNNFIQDNMPDHAGSGNKYYVIEFTSLPNSFNCSGNYSDTNLIKVSNLGSVSSKTLRRLQENQLVTTQSVLSNVGTTPLNWMITDIQEGSGSIFSLNATTATTSVIPYGAGTFDKTSEGLRISTDGSGITGFRSANVFKMQRNLNHVIGIKPFTQDSFDNGNLKILVVDIDASQTIQRFDIPLTDMVKNNNKYLSLPSFSNSGTRNVYILVFLDTRNTGSVIIELLNFQAGSIANPNI